MINTIKNKRILFCARVLLVLMVVFSCCMTVIAADTTGSIRLTCRGKLAEQTVPLVGDQYALIQIAQGKVGAYDALITYTICPAFAEYDSDWTGLSASQSRDLARKLAEVVVQTGNYERLGTTDQDGAVTFNGLSAGLYLLVRVHTAPDNAGFLLDPCLQQVPQIVNDEMVYQIEVSPKYVVEKPEQPPNLPQTGQLKWPVPVLMVSGIVFFLAGMEMCFGRRKTEGSE